MPTASLPKTRAGARTVNLGSDPELFFVKTRRVMGRTIRSAIGAEKILPKIGISHGGSKVIIDGVQGELNPGPATCREQAGNIIKSLVQLAHNAAKAKKAELSFEPAITITKRELNSLSESSQKFGCTPSFNAYGEAVEIPDGHTHLVRYAGGHIHLGYHAYDGEMREFMKKSPDVLVKMLDILVGNTMVLIDRDPGNALRRQVYGRAGEFRTPAHGVEYRTPSNFWLKRIEYIGLVFGYARGAVELSMRPDWVRAFMKAVKEEDIRNAINNNDFDLAMKNFKKIRPLLEASSQRTLFNNSSIEAFLFFVSKGEDFWFKDVGTKHWLSQDTVGHRGWEYFIGNNVIPAMRQETKKKATT